MKPTYVIAACASPFVAMFGILFGLILLGSSTSDSLAGGCLASGPSAAGQPPLVSYYLGAAAAYRLGPVGYAYLAAINKVETDFGTDIATSPEGAIGWMQFMPSTFAQYAVSITSPRAPADPDDPQDAIYTAARYLQAGGAPGDWPAAIFAYNHAGWYVAEVQTDALRYVGVNGLANLNRDISAAWGTRPQPAPAPAVLVSYSPGAGSGVCCAGAAGSPSVSATTATGYVQGLAAPQQAAFAVVSASGQVLAADNATTAVYGASITKAMLLVAYLEQLGDRPVPPDARAELEPMIEISDNAAGSWTFAQVGAAGVAAVADQVGMTGFRLDTSDPDYTLGQSLVTALDQARLFARIDQLMPALNRTYGMGLLSDISAAERWGILSAGIAGITASKAGWKPEASGWVVNQAAQISTAAQTLGVAVTSQGEPSQTAGEQVLQTVSGDLFAPGGAGACAQLNIDVAPVPGSTAVIMPDGLARPPAAAPTAVQAMVAAGDRIDDFDYQWGGGHANPALSDSQTDPQPQGGLRPGDNGTAGYDCSGATDYVLWGGGFGASILAGADPTSGELEQLGDPGPGRWVTWWANNGHVFIQIAGIVFDTGHQFPAEPAVPSTGPRWTILADVAAQQAADGPFQARHPEGL